MTEKFNAEAQVEQDETNRGYDNKLTAQDIAALKVTLMSVDEIIVKYLTDIVNPTIVVNGVQKKVPIFYGSPERWSTVRQDVNIRDTNTSKLQTPMIMLRRTQTSRGALSNPVNKYLQLSWQAGWNRHNVYDQFAVLNGIRPSQQMRAVMIPDYVDLTYEVFLWTEFEEQMSDLVGQITVENDEYWGQRNDFKFRIKIDEFSSLSDLDSSSDRVIRTQFSMKVGAYLIPERVIQKFKMVSTNQKSYTSKKTVIFTEIEGV